jgi:AraC family transcriptional regulator
VTPFDAASRKIECMPVSRGVAKAVEFIDANIDERLALDLLAKQSSMSVYHFARRFKASVGVSPHRYIVNRRVHRAKELMQRGRCCLADLSLACGFSSQAHFTTAFRREFGVTPGRYRIRITSHV